MRADMVRAYVETLLERLTGSDGRIEPDADGDYPVRYRQALYYVRLIGDVHPVVQVFSVAVKDVAVTPGLLSRLNDINADISFARVLWVREQVLVETDLVGGSIDPEAFGNACRVVATITDRIGAELAAEFGGTTAFADEKRGNEDPGGPTGLYL